MKLTCLLNTVLFTFCLYLNQPVAVRAFPSDGPASSLITRGSNATWATPGFLAGRTSNTGFGLEGGLLERQAQCDAGYSFCSDRSTCCPVGGACCSDRTCCGPGYYCMSGGCCPDGEICSGTSSGCSVAGSYPCENDNVCCPTGTVCYRDANNEPACREGGGSGGGTTTRTIRTTSKEPELEPETDFATPTFTASASASRATVASAATTTDSSGEGSGFSGGSGGSSGRRKSSAGVQERSPSVAFGLVSLVVGHLLMG